MPLPRPGDGDILFTQGQVVPLGVLFLAPYVAASPEPAPEAKLGDSEPGGTWVKMPALRDDTFAIDENDPNILEYRRGFRQRYFGEVVRQAATRTITFQWDEVEPKAIAKLTGDTPDELGSSPNTGRSLDIGSGEYYARSLLMVFYEALSDTEYHLYSPHVLCRYKWAKNNEFMVLDLAIKLISFKNASNQYKDVTYFQWD